MKTYEKKIITSICTQLIRKKENRGGRNEDKQKE